MALDSAGRVLIPVMHMERVGLDKDVMLIAYNDRIERLIDQRGQVDG